MTYNITSIVTNLMLHTQKRIMSIITALKQPFTVTIPKKQHTTEDERP